MTSAVGVSAYGVPDPTWAPSGSSIAALELRVSQDQIQLNDWTTCVSAKTPKGQAAIQKISGEISGTKEQIARAAQNQSGAPSAASAASAPDAQSVKTTASLAASAPSRPGSLDIWA